MKYTIFLIFSISLWFGIANAGISDYVNSIGEYFGYQQTNEENSSQDEFSQKIPYEVSTIESKFIEEAAKLTGVALSELDSCQQRVVLKLKTDCHKMNDEQVAKMAVQLLNCQSYVEGRKLYPCTDDMSIKDCTIKMDSDTWTSYHLMSNRARAVCYTIRQGQFRNLAENTVNRLMGAAQDQLKTLGKIAHNQENLREMAETTYEKLTEGHDVLTKQQEDIQKAQFHGQLAIEDNIRRLVEEKKLILETHNQLFQMTKTVKEKLEKTSLELDNQNNESKVNHQELIRDLLEIQGKTNEVFQRIDESASLLMKQNQEFRRQYEETLVNLAEVNRTVHNLVTLVGGTRQALEERLSWLTTSLGGTDLAIERLYLILWHFAFMLMAMLSCAFLTASLSTRIAVVSLPPLNLALAFYGDNQHLDAVCLAAAIGVFVLIQSAVVYALNYRKKPVEAISYTKVDNKLNENGSKTTNSYHYTSTSQYTYNDKQEDNEVEEEENSFSSLTPPISRSDFYSPRLLNSSSRGSTPLRLNSLRNECQGITRSGTPCKLSALSGKGYCYRHQKGDSVMR